MVGYQPLYEGASYEFGRYPQGNDGEIRPIEWVVSYLGTSSIMLCSRYILDVRAFHHTEEKTTWEQCSLHNWLVHDFYYGAFNERERAQMLPVMEEFGCHDKVFLLTHEDVTTIWKDDVKRKCKPTSYAKTRGAWENDEPGFGVWWTKEVTNTGTRALAVDSSGTVKWAYSVDCDDIGVRPMIVIGTVSVGGIITNVSKKTTSHRSDKNVWQKRDKAKGRLLTCSECGHKVSEFAVACPSCGCPMSILLGEPEKAKKEMPKTVSPTEGIEKSSCSKSSMYPYDYDEYTLADYVADCFDGNWQMYEDNMPDD